MTDYDFKSLNDKEFEALCTDLLGQHMGVRFERFKPGKDSGVDGRFFANEKNEVILQCKHWANTPLNQLVTYLKKIEKPKIDKLKPNRYIIAVSNPLSRADKKAIYAAMSPYIVVETDVFGKEDLNDFIGKDKSAEQRHYKLWLKSSSIISHLFNNAIIGRSAFSLEEIVFASSKYVVTANHKIALQKLERFGVVIITGEPGVGKTTLADHLCLHYVSQGFSYLKISEDIREAETAFDADSKQIIYFDDFLGRNYLEALKGHEGSQITQFMRRVSANKNKRFVLTSRSTILNQGKLLIDSFEQNNIQKNEIELRIQSLTGLDKAQILYNHIWHSTLNPQYVDQLYVDKRYRKIIEHKNFNPRLVSYILDSTRLDNCSAEDYWNYIVKSLKNPSQIWENPFVAQQDDFGRALIFLLVLHGSSLGEAELGTAYRRYIALEDNKHFRGRQEFQYNLRLLTGSFFNRTVASNGAASVDLFNTSIADYVLRRYAGDITSIKLGLQSLKTTRSLITLHGLWADNHLKKENVTTICFGLIENLKVVNFEGVDVRYVSSLCGICKQLGVFNEAEFPALDDSLNFIRVEGAGHAMDDSIASIQWGMERGAFSESQALCFLRDSVYAIESFRQMKATGDLLSAISEQLEGRAYVLSAIKTHIVGVYSECFTDFIDVSLVFSNVEYGDHVSASKQLEKAITEDFSSIGFGFDEREIASVLLAYDVVEGLHSFHENSFNDNERREDGPAVLVVDEIDDLFDRG